jgi:hypothetical protein
MHFRAKAKPVHFPVQVVFSPNQNIQLRVISAGQRPLSFPWFNGASAIAGDAHFTGSTTATLNITAITTANAGTYSVRITNAMNQVFTHNNVERFILTGFRGSVIHPQEVCSR